MKEKKKSWARRHWILTVILVIFGAVVLFGIIGSMTSKSDNSSQNYPETNNEQNYPVTCQDGTHVATAYDCGKNKEYLECNSDADCATKEKCDRGKCVQVQPLNFPGSS